MVTSQTRLENPVNLVCEVDLTFEQREREITFWNLTFRNHICICKFIASRVATLQVNEQKVIFTQLFRNLLREEVIVNIRYFLGNCHFICANKVWSFLSKLGTRHVRQLSSRCAVSPAFTGPGLEGLWSVGGAHRREHQPTTVAPEHNARYAHLSIKVYAHHGYSPRRTAGAFYDTVQTAGISHSRLFSQHRCRMCRFIASPFLEYCPRRLASRGRLCVIVWLKGVGPWS